MLTYCLFLLGQIHSRWSRALEFVRKLSPRIVIPMHYKTPVLKFDLDGSESFLSQISHVERAPGRVYTIDASELPRELTAVLVSYE